MAGTRDLTRLDTSIDIDSPRWSVWAVITDPSYFPKLYLDAISVQLDPPGPVRTGQRCTILGKVGKTRVEVPIQFTTVDRDFCLAHRALPGGLFAKWNQTVTLSPRGLRTIGRVESEYDLAPAYSSKVADIPTWNRVVSRNLLGYLPRVKEICELLSLPR